MANKESLGRRTIAGVELGGGGLLLLKVLGSVVSGGFSVTVALEALVGGGLIVDGKNRWSDKK